MSTNRGKIGVGHQRVLQVHGVDEHGKVVLRRQLRRSQVVVFFSRLEPCLIGMEACASSHYWARKLMARGIRYA